MRYTILLALAFVGCAQNARLQKYQYGLFHGDDPSLKDRIALIDGKYRSAAETNCEALVKWHSMAFPTHAPLFCVQLAGGDE
jgi:hypothetical protein